MDYSRNFGSLFPSESISVGTHKDVDNAIVGLINQYNAYVASGNIASASALYEQNKNALSSYMIDAPYLNRLEEEIYNTGLYAMTNSGTVISNKEPEVEQNVGDYWFIDY